ncbi:MAG: hypothetical protein WAU00_12315, partial [Caldilinea sp.]
MIHWLIQSFDDCPDILRGDVTPAWLGAAEQARTFKIEKRRRDWLLGRWTAKHLVQRYLAQTTRETPDLATILIGADADGAPYASCELRGARGEEEGRLPLSLSISHSHGTAFCGLVEMGRVGDYEIGDWRGTPDLQSPISNLPISQSLNFPSLGCDIEFIEPREANFVRNFFAAEEMAAVERVRTRAQAHGDVQQHRMNSTPARESALKRTGAADPTGFSRFFLADADFNRRGLSEASEASEAGAALAPEDVLVTAIWSAKEAVLKA